MSERTCTFDDCDGKVVARGWCRKHYGRWQKHGDPSIVLTPASRKPKPLRTCSLDDCATKHFAKGLCHRHYSARYYHEHVEQQRATQAAYRERNREATQQRAAAWRRANPERVRALNKTYRIVNADALKEKRRAYRIANRDVIRNLNNAYKARKRNAPVNDLTAQQWTEVKALYRQRCAYCGCKPKLLTMDHVQPLSRGGSHTVSNVVPACGPCNFRKNAGRAPSFQPLLT